MCTTIGFLYKSGNLFERTLEIGMILDNKVLFIPKDQEIFTAPEKNYKTKFNTLGSEFFEIPPLGDGINEMELMASSNFFLGYAGFSSKPKVGMIITPLQMHSIIINVLYCIVVDEVKKEGC